MKKSKYVIVLGLFYFIGGLLFLANYFINLTHYDQIVQTKPGWLVFCMFGLSPVFILLFLFAGVGMLRFRVWARKLTIFLLCLSFIANIVTHASVVAHNGINAYMSSRTPGKLGGLVTGQVLILIALFHLTRQKTKSQFE